MFEPFVAAAKPAKCRNLSSSPLDCGMLQWYTAYRFWQKPQAGPTPPNLFSLKKMSEPTDILYTFSQDQMFHLSIDVSNNMFPFQLT